MQQAAQHVPLVKRKSDFNGINEVYIYDGNNYLTDVTDRNGSVTHYTNEQVIGNPTQIRHPDQTHVDYNYSDLDNPYHIRTVTFLTASCTTRQSNWSTKLVPA
jgi:YD repeat-containing protein